MRGEFGYWVFEGDGQPAQRPSWNYRAEDGGGITVDMFCHWNYVMEGLLGTVRGGDRQAVTHIPTRWDEAGQAPTPRPPTTPPTASSRSRAASSPRSTRRGRCGCTATNWSSSRSTAPHGSAVAGLRRCVAQQRAHTPKPVWNPDLPVTEKFRDQWLEVPANADLDNGFKLQWEEYLRDVVAGRPHRFGLLSAARGVQLAELGLQSSARGRRMEIPEIVL